MNKVLIIEDDQDIANLLLLHLKDLYCEVELAHDGQVGLEKATSQPYDLLILDLMLPLVDGLEICRKLRAQENHTPILMLTAKSEEIDKILGLETGADDYLTKPFSVREFIARVKAIFRRSEMSREQIQKLNEADQARQIRDLTIDLTMRKVSRNGKRIELTPKEFDLLALLVSHPGRSYSREQLLNLVWGYEFSGYEHTVNSHINRLRSKIEPDVQKPQFILTTWGVGYRFTDELR